MDDHVAAIVAESRIFEIERVPLGDDPVSISQSLADADFRPGLFKWAHYFDVYRAEFLAGHAKPARILEIGVFRGASLALWKAMLGADAIVVGIDVDPACARYADPAAGIFVAIGDQSDPAFLRAVTREHGPFDIILDDGGHRTSQQIISFAILYREALADRGVYMVEDVHTSYWPSYQDTSASFVDLAKELVDRLHEPYLDHDVNSFRLGHPQRLSTIDLSWFCRNTTGVAFYDSIVVVHKRLHEPPMVIEFEDPPAGPQPGSSPGMPES